MSKRNKRKKWDAKRARQIGPVTKIRAAEVPEAREDRLLLASHFYRGAEERLVLHRRASAFLERAHRMYAALAEADTALLKLEAVGREPAFAKLEGEDQEILAWFARLRERVVEGEAERLGHTIESERRLQAEHQRQREQVERGRQKAAAAFPTAARASIAQAPPALAPSAPAPTLRLDPTLMLKAAGSIREKLDRASGLSTPDLGVQ